MKGAFFIVEPNHQQLSDLSPLLEAGYLRPFVGTTSSLEDAPEVYRGVKKSEKAHGKAVVIVD